METENAQWFILSQLGINNSIHKILLKEYAFIKRSEEENKNDLKNFNF